MSHRSSHTHCQAAQAGTQAKTWQRVCLSNRTTVRQMDGEKEALGGNWRLAKKRVQNLNEVLCFISSLVLADS
jgi:hypothetical protein